MLDCGGLYATPEVIDLHVHASSGTNECGSYAVGNSSYPDGNTSRAGVTAVFDPDCAVCGTLRRSEKRSLGACGPAS